jgi:hypothetical protein
VDIAEVKLLTASLGIGGALFIVQTRTSQGAVRGVVAISFLALEDGLAAYVLGAHLMGQNT